MSTNTPMLELTPCFEQSRFGLALPLVDQMADPVLLDLTRFPGKGVPFRIGWRSCFAIVQPLPMGAGSFVLAYDLPRAPYAESTVTDVRVRAFAVFQTILLPEVVREHLPELTRSHLTRLQQAHQ